MWAYKAIYVGAVLFVGFGGIFADFLYPDYGIVLPALCSWLLAVLTFPLGSLASVIDIFLIFMGASTPIEAIFVMTPVYAVLGYVQWYRILPRIYRKRATGDLENVFS
jgi:hypothetical protein